MKTMTEGDEGPAPPGVTAILSYSRGLACSMGPGSVLLLEKTEEDSYRRIQEIQIPPDPHSKELSPTEGQQVHSMCMSPAEESLAISTQRGQLYSINLACLNRHKVSSHLDTYKEEQLYFDFLSQSFHSNSITGLSVCIRKPLIATSSLDRSVRIWNYDTKVLELYKEFQEEALSVALHPTGLFLLVGFTDKLRLMNLLMDDLRTFQEFTVRCCRECTFSHGGHMFAAANGNVVHIYSFTSFENIINLKGHNGKVRAVKWSLDDSRLVSCGMDGAVYEWNVHTGKRQSESVLKSCSYTDVSFSSDCKTILAVGSDLTLKEIQDCQVMKEVPADDVAHTALAVSHSGKIVFTGAWSGAVRAIKYPLPIQREWITYQAHCGPVTKMVMTYDDQFLLTVSEDGCLLMWKIIDKEGRGLKSNKHMVDTQEILVTKTDLEEKNQKMLELKMRLEELQMENEYQLRLKDINHNEKLRELSDRLNLQIHNLKTSQLLMKTEMEKQEQDYRNKFANAITNSSIEVENLERSYNQKLLMEYEKYQHLQQEQQGMQEDYEEQLQAVGESRRKAVEELTQLYEARLQEKTQLLAQCQQEAQQEIAELKEIIRQMEEDEEKKIHKTEIQYEMKLRCERQTNTELRGKTGSMTEKFHTLQRQIDDKSTDLNQLKQERQRLLGLIRSLESNMEDLKRQISGHQKTDQDKDNTISGLKKKNQELEKFKFVLEFQLSEVKKQSEPQQDDIKLKREKIRKLEDGLVQSDRSNTQLKLTVSDLRLKLRSSDKELHKEMQKSKDLETYLQRLRSELHNCVGFIQDPKKLKESVQMVYSRFVAQADGVKDSSMEDDVKNAIRLHRDHLEKTINSLKTRLDKSAQQHEKAYVAIMKENMALVAEINELRRELRLATTQVKDHKAELAAVMKSRKSRPGSDVGPRREAIQEEAS